MTLIDEKPANLPTTDALAQIPDDLLGPIPAELRLGSNTLLILIDPRQVGDTVTICARLRIVREGKEQLNVDGDVTHFRSAKLVAAWLKGDPEPPDSDADQGPLYPEEPGLLDANGNVVDHNADDDTALGSGGDE